MTAAEMQVQARLAAMAHGLDPAVVCAVVEQESGWNPWAIRYEPGFFTRYVERLVTAGKLDDITEGVARSFSWGLMQIMGECAREHGYAGNLAALCDPAVGLEWGCLHLKSKVVAAGGDAKTALLLWNGGGNASYPDEVMARMAKYKTS